MEREKGFEPSASSLARKRSTTELLAQTKYSASRAQSDLLAQSQKVEAKYRLNFTPSQVQSLQLTVLDSLF